MTKEEQELLTEIREHLNSLHTKWANDPNRDGHHKSNEGYIGVTIWYPNWFESEDYLEDKPEVKCEVYSYLFGHQGLYEFDSLKEAWLEVKGWSYEIEEEVKDE